MIKYLINEHAEYNHSTKRKQFEVLFFGTLAFIVVIVALIKLL